MRYKGLNKKQQTLLEKNGKGIIDLDDLPSEVFEELMRLGNHELMWQAGNRFLGDQEMQRIFTDIG